MKKAPVVASVLLFMALTMMNRAYAAVPQTMNYQGYLTDAAGAPVNGPVNLVISLYSATTGTESLLWTETHEAVQVTKGRYSVMLGNGSPTPAPINLPFDAQYYLGIKAGADDEMTPRQPLTSMGYALRAARADSIASSDQIVSTMPTGTAPFIVSSTTMVPNLNAEMVGGKTAADLVSKAGGTMTGSLNLPSDGLTVGTNQLVVSGGKVGIGTAAPNEQLELTGNLRLPAGGVIMKGSSTLMHSYGTYNFFAGEGAGNLTMTGTGNTASGHMALHSDTTGYYNTASGYFALYANTIGYNNTASGRGALYSNTAGNANTASGTDALYSNTTGGFNTANGYFALKSNTTGGFNTASGYNALDANTIGAYNIAIGYAALSFNTTGNNNTAVGTFADVTSGNFSNAAAIGYNAKVNASNKVRIGNTSVTVIEGQVGWSYPSDIRIKQNVEDISQGLSFIRSLRPVQYRMKNGNERIDFGFIAQDIESLLGTEYNVLGIGEDTERTLSLRYTDFIAPMVKAMQEQQEIIESQKAEIDGMKARLAAIEALLSAK